MSSYGKFQFSGEKPFAIDFLRTAAHALPRTLGDRDSIAAMNAAMELAIDSGMVFRTTDRNELEDLRITTSAGHFDPFWEGYYRRACMMGGTYPKVYESQKGFRPWIAPLVHRPVVWADRRVRYGGPNPLEQDTRIAPGFALLIASDAEKDEPGLARVDAYQIWQCTSIGAEMAILCRYKHSPKPLADLESRSGQPAKRWKLTRAQWAETFKNESEASSDAADDTTRPRERATA
jgi:hypothetical protein